MIGRRNQLAGLWLPRDERKVTVDVLRGFFTPTLIGQCEYCTVGQFDGPPPVNVEPRDELRAIVQTRFAHKDERIVAQRLRIEAVLGQDSGRRRADPRETPCLPPQTRSAIRPAQSRRHGRKLSEWCVAVSAGYCDEHGRRRRCE